MSEEKDEKEAEKEEEEEEEVEEEDKGKIKEEEKKIVKIDRPEPSINNIISGLGGIKIGQLLQKKKKNTNEKESHLKIH